MDASLWGAGIGGEYDRAFCCIKSLALKYELICLVFFVSEYCMSVGNSGVFTAGLSMTSRGCSSSSISRLIFNGAANGLLVLRMILLSSGFFMWIRSFLLAGDFAMQPQWWLHKSLGTVRSSEQCLLLQSQVNALRIETNGMGEFGLDHASQIKRQHAVNARTQKQTQKMLENESNETIAPKSR